MAIEKFGNGGFQDQIKIKGTGVTKSLSLHVQERDAGGLEDIEEVYQGGYRSMVITSGGNMLTLAEYVDYVNGGGADTITGQLIGGGSNVIVDGGVMQNLVEKQSGAIQVLEEPEIALLETDPVEDSEETDPESDEDPE